MITAIIAISGALTFDFGGGFDIDLAHALHDRFNVSVVMMEHWQRRWPKIHVESTSLESLWKETRGKLKLRGAKSLEGMTYVGLGTAWPDRFFPYNDRFNDPAKWKRWIPDGGFGPSDAATIAQLARQEKLNLTCHWFYESAPLLFVGRRDGSGFWPAVADAIGASYSKPKGVILGFNAKEFRERVLGMSSPAPVFGGDSLSLDWEFAKEAIRTATDDQLTRAYRNDNSTLVYQVPASGRLHDLATARYQLRFENPKRIITDIERSVIKDMDRAKGLAVFLQAPSLAETAVYFRQQNGRSAVFCF